MQMSDEEDLSLFLPLFYYWDELCQEYVGKLPRSIQEYRVYIENLLEKRI